MDSDDELPHWSVLIGPAAAGGIKNKEAKPGKRKASNSPTSSPQGKDLLPGKAKAIPADTEIIEISSDDEQVKCPKTILSRSGSTRSPFNVKTQKRPEPVVVATRSQGSKKSLVHGTPAHVTIPTARSSIERPGQELDPMSRISIKAVETSGEKADEDARSMTLDIAMNSDSEAPEAPVNMSRTYFERICKWVGHDVDFNVGRINLRGSNAL
ncbi:uncharacterized protein EV420DRAFT_1509533 [Desarmillaria tabescens]|uniref:Uncharacterized protein n=1 Tax=Armillaria tabescens TaxID=1929756 RepID=A0AA39T5K4_ARMTA|nr:uncharacterized protein EV420DRAFT_1509533 [Desarmillaria tabescens]KAK0466046.1 hypothetical protein EV420DRAFT_1509533 [Desarmillaria tabescens]